MGTPDQLPPQEEIQQLRSRIAQLEEEIQIRRDDADWLSAFDRQYREVFDNLSVCMFLVDVTSDESFKFVAFNPAEERAVGLSSAAVCGKFVEDVFAKDLAQKLTGNYRRCLEAQGPITYDDELNLPSGTKYFHSNLIPLRDPSGNIHRIVGACLDMTDFRRTQEHALATQKFESLGVMASGIAHDLNNLLGTIAVESEVLMGELEGNSPARESLSRIEAVAGRASEIMRQLMVYAVPESANLEPVDLVGLVKEMVQLMKVSISKSATLEVALPDHLPMILANASQIRQVVLNLITNASEALEGKEGVISVTLAEVHFDGEFLPDQRPSPSAANYVRLLVSDTGCGMTPEVQAGMFDPFFTTKGAGRGLGLAAVQGIIRSHTAKLRVWSAPGSGSQIEVLLPCAAHTRDAPGRGVPTSPSGADSLKITVLVIDDEGAFRSAVAKMLRQKGFSVMEAGDGQTGVDLFRANAAQINVVLLDVTLPGLSSKRVLQELKKAKPTVNVIVTSAYGPEQTRATFGGELTHAYIRKPYRSGELTDLIRKTCLGALESRAVG